jgi:hypothetical protein
MSQASSRPNQGPPESSKKGRLLPPSRIAALVLLIVIGLLFFHEYLIRTDFDQTRKEVLAHMPDEKAQESTLLMKDMPKYLHGSYKHSAPEADVDVYLWEGWVYSYQIRLTHEASGFVSNVETH